LVAYVPLSRFRTHFDLDQDQAFELMDEIQAMGWAEVYEVPERLLKHLPDAFFVTLGPSDVNRLGLELKDGSRSKKSGDKAEAKRLMGLRWKEPKKYARVPRRASGTGDGPVIYDVQDLADDWLDYRMERDERFSYTPGAGLILLGSCRPDWNPTLEYQVYGRYRDDSKRFIENRERRVRDAMAKLYSTLDVELRPPQRETCQICGAIDDADIQGPTACLGCNLFTEEATEYDHPLPWRVDDGPPPKSAVQNPFSYKIPRENLSVGGGADLDFPLPGRIYELSWPTKTPILREGLRMGRSVDQHESDVCKFSRQRS
jgi:hypothetical protein